MIRFGGRTSDGRKVVGLALGNKNLKRLKRGEPIFVDGRTVGAPEVVVIIGCAESSDQVMRELKAHARKTDTPIGDLDAALKEAGIDRKP